MNWLVSYKLLDCWHFLLCWLHQTNCPLCAESLLDKQKLPPSSDGGWSRRQGRHAGATERDHSIAMSDIGFGQGVQIGHLGQRIGRRVVKRKSLEEWTSKDRFRRILRESRHAKSVAQHDETAETAFEACLGIPGNLNTLVSFGQGAHVERRRWQGGVGHRSRFHIIHPSFRHGGVGQPEGLLWIPFEFGRR